MFFYTFWLFLLYSFGGYLLEKLYAWARRSSHRVRKCFLRCRCVRCTAWLCWRCWLCRRI